MKNVTMIIICFFSFQTAIAIDNVYEPIENIKGAVGTVPLSIDIPEGIKGIQGDFATGASNDSIVTSTFNKRTSANTSFNAKLGYACSSFDPFNNVEQMMNNAVDSFKRLPQQFVLAAQAAIAAAPAYLLNKINPTLYNVITKNLDEAFELFEAEYKSCAQIEREVQLGNNNPYGQLFKASVARNQQIIIGEGGLTIEKVMQRTREEGAKSGIMLESGQTYGGQGQKPVNISRSLILAGSNLLMGRPSKTLSPFGLNKINPMTSEFDSPEAMIKFVRDIYGDLEYDLMDPKNNRATPGIGYQHIYITTRNHNIKLLRQFIKGQISREKYQIDSNSQISPEYLKEIRRMSPTQQDITIDDYARQIAIKQILAKLDFVHSAIQAGLREPNIATSGAYSTVVNEARNLMNSVQNDIAHLNNARYL